MVVLCIGLVFTLGKLTVTWPGWCVLWQRGAGHPVPFPWDACDEIYNYVQSEIMTTIHTRLVTCSCQRKALSQGAGVLSHYSSLFAQNMLFVVHISSSEDIP